MKYDTKQFKIFMILLCSLLFAFQIYYMVSIFLSYLDMKEALEIDNLKYIYEAHPNLLISRIIVAFMKTQNLFVNFLSGVMVVFLFLGALDIFDIIYFGILLVSIYYSIHSKNLTLKIFTWYSSLRLILFILFVIAGGICVLSVFTIGNISVSQAVELGVFVLPFYLIFLLFFHIIIAVTFIKLELRKS